MGVTYLGSGMAPWPPDNYPGIKVSQAGICICCGLPTLVAEGVSGVQWNLCRGNPVQEWEDAA